MKSRFTRRNTAVGAIALAVGLVIGTAGGGFAGGGGMPADKTAVAGAAVQDIGPEEEHEILSQRMKVSSPADLILGVTAECTILTRLVTNNTTRSSTISGSVDIRITIDDKPVPVQTVGFDNDNNGTIDEGEGSDDGTVTFCNRTYQRTVADDEGDSKVDKQDDYIRTKAANAFNWVALNVGTAGYDSPANGNNILDIRVFARYTNTGTNGTCLAATQVSSCSEAYVGKRTLVIEPVHAAVNEQSEPATAPTTEPPVAGISLP